MGLKNQTFLAMDSSKKDLVLTTVHIFNIPLRSTTIILFDAATQRAQVFLQAFLLLRIKSLKLVHKRYISSSKILFSNI